MQKNNLLKLDEVYALSYDDVKQNYMDHLNSAQVNILKTFSFGRELLSSSKGEYLITDSGRQIFDATVSSGVMGLGHNHDRLIAARNEFGSKNHVELQKLLMSRFQAALAKNLSSICPGDLSKVFFCNSGSEAIDGALKLAYKYHGGKRKRVLVSDIAFHGNLLGSGGLTSEMHKYFPFPTIPGIEKYIYDDIETIKEKVEKSPDDYYAILVEPVNASSMKRLSDEFLTSLRKLCNEYNIILICDEIYTGMGKTGDLFAFEKSNIIPDVVTISKTLGGGKSSISSFVTRESIYNSTYENMKDAYLHSTTYQGMGEECITALEAINIIVEGDLLNRVKEIENIALKSFSKLKKDNTDKVSEVRAHGSLFAVVLHDDIYSGMQKSLELLPLEMTKDKTFVRKLYLSSIMNEMYESKGILLSFDTHKSVPLVISFPYIVSNENIEYVIDSLCDVLKMNSLKLISKFIKNKVL